MARVTDLLQKTEPFSYSFEVTPKVSEEEIDSLEIDPLFYSVTWHAKSHQCKDMNIGPLRTASMLTRKKKNVLIHISCEMMRKPYLKKLLQTLKEKNICNLFTVLGENYKAETSDFEKTSQLIKYIREQTGDYFCIGVAADPDHCTDEKLWHIKEKIENGGNFIISQVFFEVSSFKQFKERCENINITVPVIAGVFPDESYLHLIGFIKLFESRLCSEFVASVDSKEGLRKKCSDEGKIFLHKLKVECECTHFHFFTLNKVQEVTTFIQECNF